MIRYQGDAMRPQRWIRMVAGFTMAIALLCLDDIGLLAQEGGTVVAADKRVQGRSYTFAETGQTIPYALFVPSSYDASKAWPLIVGLHGRGRPFDWLMGYEGIVDFAQRDGYIMVTPLGYHPIGWYGSNGPGVSQDLIKNPRPGDGVLPSNLGELSEKDVMNVLELVRREFKVDDDRIYLWGHSMGGAGTFHLAAKHPGLWAGLAVAAPAVASGPPIAALEQLRMLPTLVLQGDEDKTVPVTATRKWVARMKELGMQHVYTEVRGGDHSLFISKNRETMSKIFAFFNIVRKSQRPPAT
jgi:predicted peptidase